MVAVAVSQNCNPLCQYQTIGLPKSGLSDVTGIVFDTNCKNTVKLRRIVTPEKKVSFQPSKNMRLFFLINCDPCRPKSATFVCKNGTQPLGAPHLFLIHLYGGLVIKEYDFREKYSPTRGSVGFAIVLKVWLNFHSNLISK